MAPRPKVTNRRWEQFGRDAVSFLRDVDRDHADLPQAERDRLAGRLIRGWADRRGLYPVERRKP